MFLFYFKSSSDEDDDDEAMEDEEDETEEDKEKAANKLSKEDEANFEKMDEGWTLITKSGKHLTK